MLLQHLNEVIEALHHLLTAMVLNDKRHLELWVLLQVVELPWVEVGNEVAIVFQRATHKPVVETLWQIV